MESKYGGWRNLDEPGNTRKQSVWWRDLKRAFNQSQQGMVIQNNMRWKVGGGDKIRFWKDKWIHQEETLAKRYPWLFLISSQQKMFQKMFLLVYLSYSLAYGITQDRCNISFPLQGWLWTQQSHIQEIMITCVHMG